MSFENTLQRLRKRERLSQLDLSLHSGVSQRHISFLESGRSKPGQSALSKLSLALNLSFADTNELYFSAGLIGPYRPFDYQDPGFAPARNAIALLLKAHLPNPAVATLRDGKIVASNTAFETALGHIFQSDTSPEVIALCTGNLFELTLNPHGLRRLMQNPDQIIPHTLRRLRHAAGKLETAEKLLKRAQTTYDLQPYLSQTEESAAALSSVLIEQYEIDGRPLNLISMVASFGSPEDVTAEAIQIELFCPQDQASETTIAWLTSHPKPMP